MMPESDRPENYENLTHNESIKPRLSLLLDILKKKRKVLELILSISENQNVVLHSLDYNTASSYFSEMSSEKQTHIDEVLSCDSVFQSLFEDIKDVLDVIPPEFKPLIAGIQAEIKAVMDLDIKIRVQEEKNKEQFDKLTKISKPLNALKKDYVLDKYKENSGKKNL